MKQAENHFGCGNLIFDTSALLSLLKDEDFLEKHPQTSEVKTTAISEYELLRGALWLKLKNNSARELNLLLKFFEDIRILPFSSRAAKIAGDLHIRLRQIGKSINDADLMIAAIAITEGESLLTADKDFEMIAGVYPGFSVTFL